MAGRHSDARSHEESGRLHICFRRKKTPAFGDLLYNLPFLLAFDVLKHALLQAREEGLFTASRHRLSDLMDSAKETLSWVDWQCLWEAVKRRNQVAHDGKLVGDIQCLQDIADIEDQLVAWGIIPTA
jgi:hypothetical protein